jgi:hypothetical protein
MRLYLDDDSASALLARLLRAAGHDVELPHESGLAGDDDPVHLGHAAQTSRVLLTHNHKDFDKLHELILIVGGHYPGILAVRKDNDPKRDLKEQGIVRALTRLLAAGLPFVDNLHILNHWR